MSKRRGLPQPQAIRSLRRRNSRRGVNAVSTGERTVQRCQGKEKYHPTGWIAMRKTVVYRCMAVGRTCDTLSEEKTPIRKKLVARVSRREHVYKRTGESQRDFLRKGGLAE